MRRNMSVIVIFLSLAALSLVNCGGGSSSSTTTGPLDASVSISNMIPAPGSTIDWSSPVLFSVTVDYSFEGVDANLFGGWVDSNSDVLIAGPFSDPLDTLLTGSDSGSYIYTWSEAVAPDTLDPLILNDPYVFYIGIITASASFLDPSPPPDVRVGFDELIVNFY